MGYGPKLTNITAGQALIADFVMQNFQAIANFVRAIPKQNLLQYRYTLGFSATMDAGSVAAISKYWGLQKVNTGSDVTQLSLAASIAAPMPIADTIVIGVEKCSPVGAAPVAADVWASLGILTFTAANTAAAFNVGTVANPRFAQISTLTGVATVNDGDWIRFVSTTGAASIFTSGNAQALLKAELRS
jgi:hypothetical protein